MTEFIAWPKTPRLFRDITVTEKIDGTNACIVFEPAGDVMAEGSEAIYVDGRWFTVTAQSRKRIITPESDNYGFARWAHENAGALFAALGPGRHYGEWWGAGIQRRYGLNTKAFSLFNTHAHAELNTVIGGVPVRPVPVLYQGPFDEGCIKAALITLHRFGSVAEPGFASPEGICVYHSQTRSTFKVTLDNNDAGKWEAGTA